MGKRELVALLCLSSWCLVTVIVLWLFITAQWGYLQCVIMVFSDHTILLFSNLHTYIIEVDVGLVQICFWAAYDINQVIKLSYWLEIS